LRALLRLLLIVLGIWICYLSLHPFVLVDSWSLYWDRLMEGLGTLAPGRPSLHLAAFVLLGLLLGLSSASGQRLMGFPIVVILPDFCLTIELLQAATTTRHPRLGDFLLDLAVAWLSYELAWRLSKRPSRLHWLTLRSKNLVRLLLAALVTIFLVSPFYRAKSSRLDNWEDRFPLLIGDELGGNRHWSGRIQEASVYSHALESEEARVSSGGSKIGTPEGSSPWLRFDFSKGTMSDRLRQRGRDSSVKRLIDHGAVLEEGALLLEGHDFLKSDAPPRMLIAQARKSGSFSLEVIVQTANAHQRGPARILTVSRGFYDRNFTLGQVDDALILRVRTPWNGKNGHAFEGRWPGILIPGHRRHIVVSYENSQYRLHMDGREILPRQDLSRGGLVLTLLDLQKPIPALFLIALPIGILLSWLLQGVLVETRRRRETGLGLLLIGLYLAAGYFAGSSPVLLTTLWLLIGLPLGDLIGSWIVGKAATGSLPSLPAGGSPESQDETT